MPLLIRPANRADAPVVIEFNRLLARETEDKELDLALLEPGVKAGLDDPARCRYFLAQENNLVLGQLAITREWSDWRNGWFWWIQSVYVKKEARQRGVFRTLVQHVEETARREPDVIGIRLYVDNHNQNAHQVYLRLGFQWTGYKLMEIYPLMK